MKRSAIEVLKGSVSEATYRVGWELPPLAKQPMVDVDCALLEEGEIYQETHIPTMEEPWLEYTYFLFQGGQKRRLGVDRYGVDSSHPDQRVVCLNSMVEWYLKGFRKAKDLLTWCRENPEETSN